MSSEPLLPESEAKFRALAEASPAAIFIVQGGRLTYVNPAMAAMTEREREELLGTELAALLHPSDRHRAWVEAAGEGPAANAREEVRIHTRTGGERWLDLTTTPILFEGRPGVLGTGIDISDRKRLQERMDQAQKFEALGRLAGGVAHDFNNLLLVISGEAERLLEELPQGAALRASAESIARAAERAASLTEHLLAFGRRQTLIAQAVELGDVITGLGDALQHAAGERVRIALALGKELPSVRVDRARLEQVVLNLVANARDAMPEGGEVTLGTDLVSVDEAMRQGRPWLPADSRWVRLRVRDTGAGIPQDVLPRVFEPFFTTKAGTGSGLGLSTVYGVVKQSAGFVWIDNAAGGGACVTILLAPEDASVPEGSRGAGTAAEHPRVLLVEDQADVRDLLVGALGRNGFDVLSVCSAEEALQALAASRFDVLLSDVVLPGMSGSELARRVRRVSPEVRVLLMSGYTGDALDAAEIGSEAGFIQKPFSSKVLVRRLRALLAPPPG